MACDKLPHAARRRKHPSDIGRASIPEPLITVSFFLSTPLSQKPKQASFFRANLATNRFLEPSTCLLTSLSLFLYSNV